MNYNSEPACTNCKRRGLQLDSIPWSHVCRRTRKKYCNFNREMVVGTPPTVNLCHDNCQKYMLCDRPTRSDLWPGMIWKFLSSLPSDPLIVNMSISEKWSYIPIEWRPFWLQSLINMDASSDITLYLPPAKFHLANDNMHEMGTALEELRWQTLHVVLDKYVSYPSVRCPWGCSEFIHRCNLLPFEDFLSFRANWCFGSGNCAHWTLGTKPSYPESALILENPEFEVRPQIMLDAEKGLCILSCRHHSTKSIGRYLHVPSNPLGSLSTPDSDQYAQTILQSRTLRRTKKNVYSDTFQTNFLVGGYDGLDTCYLTKCRKLGSVSHSTLLRSYLYISGRSDVRNYVAQLADDINSGAYLPPTNVEELLHYSRLFFPNVIENASKELHGSTFVTIQDAICLQEHIYKESSQSIQIFPPEDVDQDFEESTQEFFHPPWPTFCLKVHPFGGHGEHPMGIPDKYQSFLAWILVSVVVCVPVVWSSVANGIKTNRDRIGYLMRAAWNVVKKNSFAERGRSKAPFSFQKKNRGQILNLLGVHNHRNNLSAQIKDLWKDLIDILVVDDVWDINTVPSSVICIVRASDSPINESEIQMEYVGWELVVVIVKPHLSPSENAADAQLFFRHGGQLNHNWWLQSTSKHFSPIHSLPVPFSRDVKLMVYVKSQTEKQVSLKERYLCLLGGQSRCFCGTHSQLFILNPNCQPSDCGIRMCVCTAAEETQCSKPATLICGRTGCSVGICECHFQEVLASGSDYAFITKTCVTMKSREEVAATIYCQDTSLSSNRNRPSLDTVSQTNIQTDEDSVCSSNSNHSIETLDLEHGYSDLASVDSVSQCSRVSFPTNDVDDELLFHDDANPHTCETTLCSPVIGAMGPTDSFDFALDLLSQEELVGDEDKTDDADIPLTTIASREPLSLELTGNHNTPSAPLHVLLNQQGHLLIRQNAKLRMKRRHASFFQGIIANVPGRTFPLAYAEAMLKPSIFYYDFPDGTIPGALPTGLWADNKFLSRLGVASMRDHIITRVQNPSLLCSTDNQYHFLLLDKLINLGLRGNDSRLVLHRGIAETQKKEGASFRTTEGNEELRGDNVEDHSNVHKLAALIGESPPDYFYTQSCNQTTCPGVRRIRSWVTSQTALDLVSEKYGITSGEASTMLRDASAVYIHRTWNEVVALWMRYIIFSSQKPLHQIEWAWYRKEFQDENGNPSHIHAILKTRLDTSTEAGLMVVLGKVRGSLADLLHHDEMLRMKQEGTVDSLEIFRSILEDAKRYLTHRCHARCQIPKILPSGETVFLCKAPSNWLLTSEPNKHTIQDVPIEHTNSAQKILVSLDLAQARTSDGAACTVIHPLLKATRHVPKCSPVDGKFSPTNGEIFVRMVASSNIQGTTGFTLARYLTKYVADIDKVSLVLIKPPSPNDNKVFQAEHQALNNTKISSVRYHHEQRVNAMQTRPTATIGASKKRRRDPTHCHVGRPITHMETLSVLLKDVLVTSTRVFIHMPTCAREYRSALYTGYKLSNSRPQDLQAILSVVGQTVRIEMGFPAWRLFTGPQMKVIADELQAPLRTDATTYFSMRPPELLFVKQQKLYLKWFERKSTVCPLFDARKSMEYLSTNLDRTLERCPWFDGFNHQIFLRDLAIRECLDYAHSCPVSYFGTGTSAILNKNSIVALLVRLNSLNELHSRGIGRPTPRRTADWLTFKTRFLELCRQSHLPIVWCTPIYPRRKTAFLVQLLLQKGSFTTEYELMQAGSLRRAYQVAGLLDPANPAQSARCLLKTFILENLRIYPGSTYQFDRNLCQASMAINDLMLETTEAFPQCPSVLFSHMTHDTNDSVLNFIEQERVRLIDSIMEDLSRCGYNEILPDRVQVLNARRDNALSLDDTAAFFPPPIHFRQTSASHREQKLLFHQARKSYMDYVNPGSMHRNFVVCGGPGVGKTTVCQFITLFLLCNGLNVTPTSLVADRSKQLGGTHFHRLLSLKGDSNTVSPGRQAEKAIRDLYRKPELLGFLKALDAINLDELGVFAAESVAIFDMVLRYVRGSAEFMGGLLVYCTMDHLQLLPFSGTPALLSMYVINEFNFSELQESVRASNDPNLRQIGILTRTGFLTSDQKQALADLLRNHCVFVPDFNDERIPEDAVFVFGRKAPCKEAEKLMLDRMRNLHADTYLEVTAVDEESTTGGDWRNASEPTRRRLATKIRRSDILLLYPKARFEFTENEKQFNQGQLAILLEMPNSEIISSQQPIVVWKSPTGEKNFPRACECNAVNLRNKGWSPVKVAFSTTNAQPVSKGIQGRRSQYPLRPRIATTIHACMGSTLSAIVTALVAFPGCHLDFSLWEAAQIVVLLSRTEYAKNIVFVGDREATIRHILEVLDKPHRFLSQINQLLHFLFQESHNREMSVPQELQWQQSSSLNLLPTTTIPHLSHVSVFRPCDAVIGQVKCVYLLVSTRDTSFAYIGQTNNLGKRLVQHNSASGSVVTSNPALMPWAVMAYVVGFRCKRERLQFEAIWKITAKRRRANSMDQLVSLASDLILDTNNSQQTLSQFKLRLITCGSIIAQTHMNRSTNFH